MLKILLSFFLVFTPLLSFANGQCSWGETCSFNEENVGGDEPLAMFDIKPSDGTTFSCVIKVMKGELWGTLGTPITWGKGNLWLHSVAFQLVPGQSVRYFLSGTYNGEKPQGGILALTKADDWGDPAKIGTIMCKPDNAIGGK